MTLRIGPLTDEQMPEAYRAFTTALQTSAPSPTQMEHRRGSWFASNGVVAYDGERIVGHVGCLPFVTMVPGGARVATGGLSRVGVLPTHRRRGALTGMMAESLRKSKERGEVLGSLRAAESPIYGRFGYGLAGFAASVKVKTHRAAFAVPVSAGGRFEVMQGTAFLEHAKLAYQRCLIRPGMLERPDWYWSIMYEEHCEPTPHVADWGVIHFDERSRPDGFARWAPKSRNDWDAKGSTIEAEDIFGASVEIETALWQFLLELDLVDNVVADARPVDEALPHRLVDARAVETNAVWDEQWVRLIDVPAALAARTYVGDDSVAIEIAHDSVFGEHIGTFEVGNAGVKRVRRKADIALSVDALGAAYLGGTSIGTLRDAGRVSELRSGGVERAARLFRSDIAPWCGTFF